MPTWLAVSDVDGPVWLNGEIHCVLRLLTGTNVESFVRRCSQLMRMSLPEQGRVYLAPTVKPG
ncbi:MAG: hypothetical protein EBS56_02135 [Planctomycetia bacterium]|nr:hypothetical protein [Planctomycetia bacterium]